ncbi:MAG: SAM-dependent methyltransferase [Bacteroidales bacterium]|jgi:16S rRNA (cytidine1402-2'-O)-methyltransferase
MSISKGKLYLLPSLIGDAEADKCIPSYNKIIINKLKYFIVEQQRSAYGILRSIGFAEKFDDIVFLELNEHTSKEEYKHYLKPALNGNDMGLLSEAGLPCIADPGEVIVKAAHLNNIQVIPLSGESSILTALISSGLNAESFAFNGYLPIPDKERNAKIRLLEKLSYELNQTQIFIETPYRNLKLFKSLIKTCNPDTLISIACNIKCKDELIKMKPVYQWNSLPLPDIHKKPSVFCMKYNGPNSFIY